MYSYEVPDDPKMLREALGAAQGLLGRAEHPNIHHIKAIQRLIDACDRMRPLGSNGKHGNLHTSVCGCEDKSDLRCPTCQGLVWSSRRGKWIATRETVDMVCQTCGRDYMLEHPVPTIPFWENL